MMVEAPIWEVELLVDGPVTLRHRFRTTQQKGFRPENPFYSDIDIRGIPSGLRATVTARASNEQLAYEAAVFFFGRMLDVLAFEIDLPLFLSRTKRELPHNGRIRQHVRRNVEPQEIEDAFRKAEYLAIMKPAFLRSLGWYHKGLYTEDPFDKFLAFWNSIEIVAAKYYQTVDLVDQVQAKKGCKSQVWECFKALWGTCEQWPNIPNENEWIDENYEIRNDIVHGASSVDIKKVASISNKLDMIQRVAHRFLQDWRDKFLYVSLDTPSERLPESDEELPAY